jgi:four helix bundle protein
MGRFYKDLVAWRKAMELVTATYRASAEFPKDELFGLTSQLRRAAI